MVAQNGQAGAAIRGAAPQVELEGTLDVHVEDLFDGRSRRLFTLITSSERVSLEFSGDAPHLTSGTRVRARGARAGNTLALDGSASLQTITTMLANTTGEQRTLVLLVNFQDNASQPYSLSHAAHVVFNQTHGFFYEGSFGQTWLVGDVHGWFTLPMSSTVCDSAKISTLARQSAAAAGINLSLYNRFVYGFPKNACSWWGLGSVGGDPSQAWINGNFELRVVGHELGHNFGLDHAASLDCGAEPISGSCSVSEYGDTSDIMGASAFHFQAFHKERLGWLNAGSAPGLETVQSSGTYYVAPFEPWTTATKGLRVLRNVDSRSGKPVWYYLEFRRPLGYDGGMGQGLTSGALIHIASEAGGNRSYLIDTTATDSFDDAALTVGRTFTDPYVGLSITVTSATTSGLLLTVGYSGGSCVASSPSIALSPAATTWVAPGTPVTYSVSIVNNDTANCPASTFNIVPTVPQGWTATAVAAASLAPGATALNSVTIASSATTAAGFYDVSISAVDSTNSARLGTATVRQAVASSLDMTVQPTSTSYQRGDTFGLQVRVTSGGAPVPNVTVTLVVTEPDGNSFTASTVTGPYGTATYQRKIQRRDPAGVFNVTANAAALGSQVQATTSFTVY